MGAGPVVARRSDASPSSRWRTRRQWCPAVPSSFFDLPRFNLCRADKFAGSLRVGQVESHHAADGARIDGLAEIHPYAVGLGRAARPPAI